MNSRESTYNENSATLPIMNNESDEDWSSQGSGNPNLLNNLVIKKQSENTQMNTENSVANDTHMTSGQSHPSQVINSTENGDEGGGGGISLQQRARESYNDSQTNPENSKPVSTVDDVPEISPRK